MAQRKKRDAQPQSQRQWRRMDVHLHTPASIDFQEPSITFLDILKKAEARSIDLIAFTDHNSVAGYARFLREIDQLEWLEKLKRILRGGEASAGRVRTAAPEDPGAAGL